MSSSLVGASEAGTEVVGGRGLYVIVTFRLDFHMGRVECVTCHVPDSQDVVGGVNAGWGRAEVVGGRRLVEIVIAPGWITL